MTDRDRLIRHLDATMPGRRIGSAPPEDCSAEAEALVARLYANLPAHLGLTSVRAFLAAGRHRHDDAFARAFRRAAIAAVLRAGG